MALQNNKRIERRRNREILKKFGRRQDITKSDIPNVENMEMTEVDPSTLSEGQFVPNQFETVEESSNETGLQPQQTIPLSVETLGTQTGKNIGTMFNELAQQNQEPTNPYDIARQTIMESVGDEPTLDESQLKRAKTQALVNAFGNLLQAGVGFGTMQGGGYFQAKPIDNTQVLANLEGVYDKYYKEMADYRDDKNKSKLALANLDYQEFDKERQRAIDKEKQDVIAENRAEDVKFREKELQFREKAQADALAQKKDESEKRYNLNQKNNEIKMIELGLSRDKLDELMLQSDRNLGLDYNKLDDARKASVEALELSKLQIEQTIKRNNLSEMETAFDAIKDSREALSDVYEEDFTISQAYTAINATDADVDSPEYKKAEKYVNQYEELANTEQLFLNRLKGNDQVSNEVTTTQAVNDVNNTSKEIGTSIGNSINKDFGGISDDFTSTLFGEGMGGGGTLNVQNLNNAIDYLENQNNFFKIQEEFGFSDEDAEKKRQNLVFNLKKHIRDIQSLNQ